MKNLHLFINCILKDSFIINGNLYTGFYDGSYRKLIKKTIDDIKNKSSNSSFKSDYAIIDSEECTYLRVIISIPNDWMPERFEEICFNEIRKNASIDIIAEKFLTEYNSSKDIFFSKEWLGFKRLYIPK